MAEAYLKEIVEKSFDWGKVYELKLSNGDTVDVGKFPPKGVSVGDYVSYEYTLKNGKYKNLTPGSLSKKDKPAGVASPIATQGRSSGGSYDDRQVVISKQAAVNTALSFVELLLKADALPITKSAKPDVKADIIKATVDEYTGLFYTQATGDTMTFAEKRSSEQALQDDLASMEASENWNE